jgi:hypothetical protein
MSYNSSTGVLSAGQRGAVQNVYTGNYAAGGRGAATGPGGRTVIGAGGTAGNVYTGDSVSGGRATIYNRNTGDATHISGIKGDNGGAINVGGNVYAGHDGNVYHKTDNGWQSMVGGDGGTRYTRPTPTESRDLDQDRFSREMGAQRYNFNRGSSGMMHRSFGGRRR